MIPEHLGGATPGGDPATYFPELWAWLVSIGVRSVLDVGCGEGQAIDYFASLGCTVLGLDGVDQEHPFILAHDFTEGPLVLPCHFGEFPDEYDIVWCCEFVEHVEEEYVQNFLTTFDEATDLVLMTHADPGQDGHHHVNCQTSAYWIERLASIDFELDSKLTQTTRALAAANGSPWNHYVRSGLAFRRIVP